MLTNALKVPRVQRGVAPCGEAGRDDVDTVFRPVLGSREALTRKAVARVLADEDLFDGESCYRPEEGGGPPKNIDVKFHAAVADVLPLPEEVRPTMEEFAANPFRYLGGNNWTADRLSQYTVRMTRTAFWSGYASVMSDFSMR